MSPLAKVFVVVNLILSVAFFGSSATLFVTRTNWREEALRYKKASDDELKRIEDAYAKQGNRQVELGKQHSQLNANYNSLVKEKGNLETALTELKGQVEKANLRIDTEVKEKTQLTARLQDLEKQNTEVNRLLETARKGESDAKSSMEKAINDMTRFRLDLNKSNDQHSQLLIAHQELTEKAKTMEIQLAAVAGQLDIDVVHAPPPIDAVIQAVKAEEKLVVLSVGRDDKVQPGFEFTVYRGDRFVGKVKVIKVYEGLSGAKVLYTASDSETIQVGDKAATQL